MKGLNNYGQRLLTLIVGRVSFRRKLGRAARAWPLLRLHIHLSLLSWLPRGVALRGMRLAGQLAWLWPESRRRACVNEAMLSVECERSPRTRASRHRCVNRKGSALLGWLLPAELPTWPLSEIECSGLEHIHAALAEGRGAILLGSHVGLPRLLRLALRHRGIDALYLVKMSASRATTTARRESPRRRARAFLRRRWGLDRERILGGEQLSLHYLRRAFAELRAGGLVFLAPDGQAGERVEGCPTPWGELPLRLGAFALAEMTGAPCLPTFGLATIAPRLHLGVRIEPPLDRCCEAETRDQRARCLARRHAARIVRALRTTPALRLGTTWSALADRWLRERAAAAE